MGRFTIGEVAERSGFSASALRFYERHRLIEPVARTEAGYRLYDEASLARLAFVARAKQLGCTLEEIAELARLLEDDECAPVQARLHELVTTRITDARRRAAELVRLTADLQTAAAHLGGAPVDGPCDDGCACVGGADDPVATQTVPVALGEERDGTVACTLPAAEVPGRVGEWRLVLDHVVERQATGDGGLRLVLDPAVPLDELARLVVAEQRCCAFLAFAVTADDRGVALEVRAPDEAADVLTAVFGTVP